MNMSDIQGWDSAVGVVSGQVEPGCTQEKTQAGPITKSERGYRYMNCYAQDQERRMLKPLSVFNLKSQHGTVG